MKVTNYFKALADDTRLRLLNVFSRHELNVNEIVKVLGMGQPRVSRHLKILTDYGLLHFRRNGLWTFYSLTNESRGVEFIEAIKYLFQEETILQEDLRRAKEVIDERSKETRRFFDSIAEDWQKLKREIIGEFDVNLQILKWIQPVNVAVDLGCGTGDLLDLLAQKADTVIGVDKSSGMLEQTRQRFGVEQKKIDLRIGEIEHLPMKDEEADLAVINMVLHHLPSPMAGTQEIHRVLRAGSIFIIVDFLNHNLEMMRNRFGDRWLGFSLEQVNEFLSTSGFLLKEKEFFDLKKGLKGFIAISIKK